MAGVPGSATVAVRAVDAWSPRRLRLFLAVAAGVVVLLVAGLGYAVTSAVTSPGRDDADPAPTRAARSASEVPSGAAVRDRIAARPMLSVAPQDARAGRPSTTPVPVLAVPAATRTGPAGVDTGFPRTPQGAVGQLAAIDVAVLQAMSVPYAHAVHDAWALPGAVGAARWELTGNVAAFLAGDGGRDGAGQAKEATTTVVATPAGAQVKGVDGPDWVLACVLLDVRAVIVTQARIGYGHCERMQWVGGSHESTADDAGAGRWMIAPGAPPARAPSTWPGTDLSVRAGWRAWTSSGTAVGVP